MANAEIRTGRCLFRECLQALPPVWPEDVMPGIRAALGRARRKVVVLDDDPTGTQTVHDVPVLTEWSVNSLARELAEPSAAFYVLTNSRSVTAEAAAAMNRGIARNLRHAARQSGCDFVMVSRSDSTLRGHFPAETEALVDELGGVDAILLLPFFEAGGRYTLNDVHYVLEGEWLVPAGQTAFACDPAFGYCASNLREWVEEKTRGRVTAAQTASMGLETIRKGGPAEVCRGLLTMPPGSVCVVNAAGQRDVEVFVAGLLQAEARGRRYLYRTAASFVPARCGLVSRPLLKSKELGRFNGGGVLIVVGSYVPRTSEQLTRLLAANRIAAVEARVAALLCAHRQEAEILRLQEAIQASLAANKDVVVYTSRGLNTGMTSQETLRIGQKVSEGLVAMVRGLNARPHCIVAKGGITASNLATQALDVKRAVVRGQILPGVPVWELGRESRFPGLAYVVFPGNVGGPDSLASLISQLHA